MSIADGVTECVQSVLLGAQSSKAEAPRVGDMNLTDGRSLQRNRVPDAQGLEDASSRPLPSAVVRSSKLVCAVAESASGSGGDASTIATDSELSARASARLAPTMPPPAIATSQ